MRSSRFDRASTTLHLGALLRGRGSIWSCLGLAVFSHFWGTQMASFREEQTAVKPLTTKFVKRAPRLTKPLEMKKRPHPKRRRLQRKMMSVTARIDRQRVSTIVQSNELIKRLARPSVNLSRITVLQSAQLEPQTLTQSIGGTKDPKHHVNLSLEMLDIDALDTGKYHAMVVQDPNDKRSVQGFLHIALVVPARSSYDPNIHIRHIRRLADLGMNQFTDIRTDIWPPLTFDSSEMFKVPWLFTIDLAQHFTFGDITLTDNERRNLGFYLMQGGFVHADAIPPQKSEAYAPPMRLRKLIIDALHTQGLVCRRDWSFEKLPNSHPLYHCYFDFEGPPTGYGGGARGYQKISFLEGVTIDQRLLSIISQMHYLHIWGNWGTGRGTGGDFDPVRSLQFGVNIIVFALTQEGSITHRVMDAVQ